MLLHADSDDWVDPKLIESSLGGQVILFGCCAAAHLF